MRKLRSTRFLFPLTALAAVGLWAACGGSDSQDLTSLDAGAPETSDSLDTGAPTFFPDSGSPPIPDTGAPDTALPPFDAGPIIFLDAGPDFDGGLACFAGGVLEVEPNDDPDHANTLAPTRCGVLSAIDGGGPDGGDVDWLTFQASDASTGFRIYYEGQVHVYVQTADAATKDISIAGQTLSFVKGQPYYIQLRANVGNTQQAWKVVLREDIP